MKKSAYLLLILASLTFSGCSGDADTLTTPSDIPSPTMALGEQQDKTVYDDGEKIFYFDISQEQDVDAYEQVSGLDFYYFSAGIYSPYKYFYNCGEEEMTIEQIALSLGTIMMDDFMKDYDGKTFTVTEYQNLVPHILDDTEFIEWQNIYYNALGQKIILKKNQWLCNFDCEFRYTGVYSNIGEMPKDMDWMRGLLADGSGEDYIFIIQKTSDNEYIMRAMPKASKHEL